MDSVDSYFAGSGHQLTERGKRLLDRIPARLPREFYPLQQTCQNELQRILAQLESLPKDSPKGLLRQFRRNARDLSLLETVALPALERFNEQDDVFLTRLVALIKEESTYPLVPPVVSSLSQEYFHIVLLYNLMFVPLSEGDSLLHLPDLYHELGHPLLQLDKALPRAASYQEAMLKALMQALNYVQNELDREDRQRSPAQYGFFLETWRRCWLEGWMIEFFCDLLAIYMIGPAFAWGHLHLWAKHGQNPFQVQNLSFSSHPADDARMQVMLVALYKIGFSTEADAIKKLWTHMTTGFGYRPEPEYHRCYPADLLRDLVEASLNGVQGTGIKIVSPTTDEPIYNILNQAWVQFWENPSAYASWERLAVINLRKMCNS